MVQAQVFLWACVLIFVPASIVAQDLGVNWGVIASHPLDPKIVVQMIKDNGIKKVKIFHAEKEILDALAGTDLEVMVGIPNESLKSLSEKYSVAQAWVKANITAYMGKKRVNFKYVAVGNEPFLTSYNGTFTNLTLPAMKNVLKALNEAGHGKDIKVSSPLNGDVYTTPTYKPSDGIFRPDIADIMGDICAFLHKNDAAFIVNIYPFLNLYQNPGFPENYAFFDNDDSTSMDDHGVKYRSVLDANIDTLVAALKVAKFPDIPIIVGEVGWPTDGNVYATTKNAKRFYDGLLKKMARNEGTPLRPKTYPDVYMFSLLDEDQKSIDPGMFERHWGIFSFDGQPKYPMDLSGKGQNKSLVGGKNVPYMQKQWCVYNEDAPDQKDLKVKVAWACNNTDCTTLVAGASCSGMGIETNASVAFNMYYQMSNQIKAACDFQGMAKIVKQDPSNGTCKFPIMIKSFQKTSTSSLAHSPPSTSSKSHSSSSPSGSPSPSTSTSPPPPPPLYHSPPLVFLIFVGIFTVWFA
ncbi:Glucan endo-1,3-beta-glucosidase 8 [Hibiscus syriacus]|uniref:glucan endo-1,3-beta-D-glucosidase n=1 Tax=Hibiscus syriacus TaxID=106335 RepID=A0A6A2YMZ2_HIBSY|nr:glucan endo-1,3-beta-glucosidase 8-like [Hibiscus syriacus]KAE8680698.1 Glucan endo-1,3-beta-glucosidase 8 [Hibiscus syriacus]